MLGVPVEMTTMSGRRIRQAIHDKLVSLGVQNPIVVVAAIANAYTHYCATYEEFQWQRYEAASTIFGPHTLAAHIQEFSRLAEMLVKGQKPPHTEPPIDKNHQPGFQPGVVYDATLSGKDFGDIGVDVESTYKPGQTASAIFWGANPRNNLKQDDTFLTVEQKQADGSYKLFKVDAHYETRFAWERHRIAESLITIEWDIDEKIPAGTYRLCHFGSHKNLLGKITDYSGCSSEFKVEA